MSFVGDDVLIKTHGEDAWIEIQQLKNVKLIKKNIQKRFDLEGKNINEKDLETRSQGCSYAIKNALEYYKIDDFSNNNQQIVNLYYGTISFAMAEMLTSPQGPNTIQEIEGYTNIGHGLYAITTSGNGKSIEFDEVIVVPKKGAGFFEKYCEILHVDTTHWTTKKIKTLEDLDLDHDTQCATIVELFARVPEIHKMFSTSFDSNNMFLKIKDSGETKEYFCIDITDISNKMNEEDVRKILAGIEIIDLQRYLGKNIFHSKINIREKEMFANLYRSMYSPGGNIFIKNIYKTSEYRIICFALLYALSIVARYMPYTWQRVQEGEKNAIIDAFLFYAKKMLPIKFLKAIKGS